MKKVDELVEEGDEEEEPAAADEEPPAAAPQTSKTYDGETLTLSTLGQDELLGQGALARTSQPSAAPALTRRAGRTVAPQRHRARPPAPAARRRATHARLARGGGSAFHRRDASRGPLRR